MRIYPAAPGLVVRDPVKRDAVPDDGREVPNNDLFWQRRLADGDVTLHPFEPAAVQRLDELATQLADQPAASGIGIDAEPLDEELAETESADERLGEGDEQ